MVGDWWEGHQDYTYWKKDDGMPEPNVLTAMIFLNDVTEFNGQMLLIPKSHMAGVIDDVKMLMTWRRRGTKNMLIVLLIYCINI